MSREEEFLRLLRVVVRLEGEELERYLKGLPAPVRRTIFELWLWQAHGGQIEPKAANDGKAWRVWLVMAGRGFGKTRAGAEWVWARARENKGAKIALVGANMDDVVKVMVEGESGLAAAAREGEEARWVASRQRVDFSTGATGFAYSGERPAKLRGPEHHYAWCDELAKWARAEETWHNLQLTMRLGTRPRLMVTTTPRPMALLKRIERRGTSAVTRGRSKENVHLPEDFLREMDSLYGGTRMGRQELDGELIEDVEGALFPRGLLERARHDGPAPAEWMVRVVVGVDPPASAGGDACGIVAVGLGADGVGYVLGDHSVSGLSPEGWAAAVAHASERWGADRVVVETNQGGEMVESVLRTADVALPVRPVHARFGKGKRAEPVAILFERGKAKLAGAFPELEDELAALTIAGEGAGRRGPSDRADAMVWAFTALMLGKEPPQPRLRPL